MTKLFACECYVNERSLALCNCIPFSIFQGRNPFYLDPAMVICITDGGKLTSSDGVNPTVREYSIFFAGFVNL